MVDPRPDRGDQPAPRDPGRPEGLRSHAALAVFLRALAADLGALARAVARAVRRLVGSPSARGLAAGARRLPSRLAGGLAGAFGRGRRRAAGSGAAAPAGLARRGPVVGDPAALPPGAAAAMPPPPPSALEAPPVHRAPRPRRVWRRVLGATAALLFAGLIGVAGLFAWALWGMDFGVLAEAKDAPSVVIETIEGETFASKGPFRGTPVDPAQLPQHLIDAVLAIEDRRFYAHPGVDALGIVRALVANVSSGGVVQGGSTISQQLARTLFLTQDRTLKRKLREAALALWLETRMSKEQVLARYLGSIYMGAGVHGMPAAARVYFDKDLPELTLAEAAMLAGLIKAPSDLNPRADLDAARERASVVLGAMVETGAIDQGQMAAAMAEPAALHEGTVPARSGGWFADWVYGEAAELAGSFNGALHIRSTLHPRVQAIAEASIAAVMDAEGAEKGASEAALVAMLPDGTVLALVGGRDYEASQFNRATEALRQPGSTFKPFVYYAALRQGWSMSDRIDDGPIDIGGWQPENYSGRYHGQVTLYEALVSSMNAATARLGQEVGIENVVAAAQELGIDARLDPNPSLALGTAEVTLLDLTGAYASLAAGQAPVEPWGILNFGTSAERYRLGPRTQVAPIPSEVHLPLVEGLAMAVERGTGKAARVDGFAAGKTGTTQEHRDAWFVGFNGPFVAGVWVGNDDNTPMDKVTGGDLPAKIWRQFMTDLMAMLAQGDSVLKPVGGWTGPAPAAAATGGDGAGQSLAERALSAAGIGGGRELACNVSACERAYRSFRAEDCTFQPYRGPRRRCAK